MDIATDIEEPQVQTDQEQQPTPKLKVQEFAAKIKAKYPQYKDINDTELTNRIVSKYPEYKDQVDYSVDIKKKEDTDSPSKSLAIPLPSSAPKTDGFKDPIIEEQLRTANMKQNEGVTSGLGMPKDEQLRQQQQVADAPKRAAIKKERTDKAIDETAKKVLVSKGIPLDNTKKAKEEKDKVKSAIEKGDVALVYDKKANDYVLKRTTGFLDTFADSWNKSMKATDEASDFVNNMDSDQRIEYLKNKQAETDKEFPYEGKVPSKYAGSMGQFLGSNAPTIVKGAEGIGAGTLAVALAPETLGGSLVGLPAAAGFLATAPDMVHQHAQQAIIEGFYQNKKQHPEWTDKEAMDKADERKWAGGTSGLVNAAVLGSTGGNILKEPINDIGKNVFANALRGTVNSGVKMGATSAGTEVAKDVEGMVEGYDMAPTEIYDKTIEAAKEGFTIGSALHLTVLGISQIASLPPLVLNAAKKAIVETTPIPEVAKVLEANEKEGNVPKGTAEEVTKNLEGYKAALDEVPKDLPEDAKSAVAGLIQKKQNLFDEKAPQEQIDTIDNQISEITKTGDIKGVEFDNLTGQKYGEDPNPEQPEQPETTQPSTVKSEEVKYPLETPDKWTSLVEEKDKGRLSYITPDEFLSKAKELEMNESDRKTIDKLKQHILDGKKLDPLEIYSNDRSALGSNIDGRHRAVAAKELGIKEVPVIDYTKSENKPIQNEEAKAAEIPNFETQASTTDTGTNKVEQPTEETSGIYTEPKRTILSHRGLQEVATEFGLEDVVPRDRKSDMQLYKDVEIKTNEWKGKGEYNKNIEGLIEKADKGEPLSDEQRLLLQQHLANVREKTAKVKSEFGINSKEYDAQLKELSRLKEAGQKARSAAGAALRIPDIASVPDNTLEGWMTEKMESAGVDELTAKQKEEVQKQHSDYEEKLKKSDELLSKANEEIARLKAENELFKTKKEARKRDQATLKVERESIVTSIKEKWKGAGKTQLSSDIPYRQQLAAIAPDVAKLTRNLIETGTSKLADIIDNIHETLKEISPDIKKEDVRDLIAGVYNEKKPTKNALQRQLMDVREEAKLAKRLSDLLNGEEPVNEKQKVKRNAEITKLREQVKDISGFKDEVAKNEKEALSKKEAENKSISKGLEKAEKEIYLAEKKENVRKKREAEAEVRKFEKEFEKEKKEEAKKILKAKLDDARKLAEDLAFRTPEEKALEQIKKRNETTEKKILERIKNKDFDNKPTTPFDENAALKRANPNLYKETMDAIVAKDEARDRFELEKYKDELAKRGGWKKVFDAAGSGLSTLKAVKAGVDDSVGFVQLIMPVLSNALRRPGMLAKVKYEAILDAASPQRFKRELAALHQSKYWNTIQKSGLDITEPQSLTKKNVEELYSGNLLDQEFKVAEVKVNPWTMTGGIFERLFTSTRNNLGLKLFMNRIKFMERRQMTFDSHPQEYKDAARAINEMTARGKVAPNIAGAMEAASPIIWAPKMLASTLNTLGITDLVARPLGRKGLYRSLTPMQRSYLRQEMGWGIATGIGVMAALGFAGWSVDYDPRSSTFGTVKHGTTSYNVFGRYAGMVKTIVQIITGTKEVSSGEVDLDAKGGRGVVLGKFVRGKMTPAAGEAYDYIFNSQKNMFTKEPITLSGLPNDMLTPMAMSDLKKGIDQDGSISLLTRFLPAVEGVQVMDDRDFKNTQLFTKEEVDSEEYAPLKEKGIKLPPMGTVKQHKIDVDDDHPNQAKEGEDPYGVMSDDEFKQFNDTRKKYLQKEIKNILKTEYPSRLIYPSGGDKILPKVKGSDLPKGVLEKKIEAATTDINGRVLNEMFPEKKNKIKTEYKSEEEREKEKIELEKQLENN